MRDSTLVLTDDGAWCRYFGAEGHLHAQHAADTGELHATLWPRRTIGSGSPNRNLLRGGEPPPTGTISATSNRSSAASSGRPRSTLPIAISSRPICTPSGLQSQDVNWQPTPPYPLTTSGLPVQPDIRAALDTPNLVARSTKSMKRILDAIGSELTDTAAPWGRRPT